MSLWADYLKERKNWETIESEFGFISFSLNPPECAIEEFYVVPEKRGTREAKQLADSAFRRAFSAGAVRMWASVIPGMPGSDHAMRTNLHYGFSLAGVRGNDIILMKEIKEEEWAQKAD